LDAINNIRNRKIHR